VAKQEGLFHLAIARCLRNRLRFSDYSEIHERAAVEKIPPAINKKAKKETIQLLAELQV
jgi:hypothetical protein